jgi:hypothetical protein
VTALSLADVSFESLSGRVSSLVSETDPDIDEPLQVVGTQTKAPAGVNLDDMDEECVTQPHEHTHSWVVRKFAAAVLTLGMSVCPCAVAVLCLSLSVSERAIYESVQAKKMSEKGIAFAGGANVGPAKVSTLNMTTVSELSPTSEEGRM